MSSTFLSFEQFNTKVGEQSDIMKFRELEINVVYLIKEIEEITTSYGEATILTLKTEKGGEFKVWATSILAKDLKGAKKDQDLYITSTGKKKSESTGREYYDYKIVGINKDEAK